MDDENKIETIQRHVRLAFMAVVTAAMLALTFHHAGRGLAGLPIAVGYALMVGFGLEFLRSAWTVEPSRRVE